MTIRWSKLHLGRRPTLLEEIDGLLVQQLQRDGRASFQALGRAVGLTRTAARARVSRLLAAGVIKVVALPDAAVAGQAVVAHLSADVTGSALAAAHGIAKLRSAVFVSVASGQFPVIADLRSPGEAALAADLDRLRALPGIRGIEIVRALTLVRDAYRPGPAHPAVSIDAVDRVLISGLERNGRMSYAELATLSGLSSAATRSRVLRLIRGGAVHVTVLVDAGHTGRLARVGLGITVHGPARAIAEKIAELPDVTYVLTGTGRFDVVAAADTSSETSLLRTIEQIRALRGVNRVQSWRHLQIVKESYPRMTLG
jgi:DNA-binding Lrp family transcriptional regulator